jgi:hypothetical protein
VRVVTGALPVLPPEDEPDEPECEVLVRVVTGGRLDPEPLEAGPPEDEPLEPACELLVRVVTGAPVGADPLEVGAPEGEPVAPECEALVRVVTAPVPDAEVCPGVPVAACEPLAPVLTDPARWAAPPGPAARPPAPPGPAAPRPSPRNPPG